jgi:hypothetical protein
VELNPTGKVEFPDLRVAGAEKIRSGVGTGESIRECVSGFADARVVRPTELHRTFHGCALRPILTLIR